MRHVAVNAMLGSALLEYDATLFPRFRNLLTAYAAEHGLFTMRCDEAHPCVSEADRSIDRLAGELNRAVHAALGGAINLKELLPLLMGVYGLFFVNKSQAAAQWINWVQVALDTYIDLHEDDPVVELKQSVDLMGSQFLAQQAQIIETIRTELAALRDEVRAMANTPRS